MSLHTALRRAAAQDSVDDINFLIEEKCNVNTQDENPNSLKTALHWAVIKGHIAAATGLKNASARTDIRDFFKKTSIDYAKEANNSEMLTLLGVALLAPIAELSQLKL